MIYSLRTTRADKWQSLIHASEHIAFACESKERDRLQYATSTSTALEQIRSLKEIFGPALDPVQDFEAYAVRQLLKSLESVLSRP